MKSIKKLNGVNVKDSDLTQMAENAIGNYQELVFKQSGGKISRARAIVKILEKSDYVLK